MATVEANRAPVVAERLGFDREEALTLGKSVAGLNAQSKGQSLGIFKPGEKQGEEARGRPQRDEFFLELLEHSIRPRQSRSHRPSGCSPSGGA